MPYCTREEYSNIPSGCYPFNSIGYIASPLAGPSPLYVTFRITAVASGNDLPKDFCIDFGDGETSEGVFVGNSAQVTHKYTAESFFGTDIFVPVITVTSDCGTVESHVPSENYYIYVHSGVGTIDPGGTLAQETSLPVGKIAMVGVFGFVCAAAAYYFIK